MPIYGSHRETYPRYRTTLCILDLRIDYCDQRPFWESYYIYGTISVIDMYYISYEAPECCLSCHMHEMII